MERNKLINEYIKKYDDVLQTLAKSLAARIKIPEWRDLYQGGLLEIVKSFKNFKPEKGKFSTFALYRFKAGMFTAVGVEKKQQNQYSSTHETHIEEKDPTYEILEGAMMNLSNKEKKLLSFYLAGYDDTEISALYNKQDTEISMDINKIFQKINTNCRGK